MDKIIVQTFEGVCSDTFEYLTAPGNVRCYRKGDHLFRDRETTPYVFVILSGKASLYKIGENGQKKVAFILGPGELINECLLYTSLVSRSRGAAGSVLLRSWRMEEARLLSPAFTHWNAPVRFSQTAKR